jgi:RNA polymerase-binding transcription factor DksA
VDSIDEAQAREQEIREAEIARRRGRYPEPRRLLVCVDCGEQIPDGRAGALTGPPRCQDCAVAA